MASEYLKIHNIGGANITGVAPRKGLKDKTYEYDGAAVLGDEFKGAKIYKNDALLGENIGVLSVVDPDTHKRQTVFFNFKDNTFVEHSEGGAKQAHGEFDAKSTGNGAKKELKLDLGTKVSMYNPEIESPTGRLSQATNVEGETVAMYNPGVARSQGKRTVVKKDGEDVAMYDPEADKLKDSPTAVKKDDTKIAMYDPNLNKGNASNIQRGEIASSNVTSSLLI